MKKYLDKLSVVCAGLMSLFFITNASALSIHGGLNYIDRNGVVQRTVILTAKQLDEAGNAKGTSSTYNHVVDRHLFGKVQCLIENYPGIYTIYGTPNKNAGTLDAYTKFIIIAVVRNNGQADAATTYFEEDLGSCEDVAAILNTFTAADLTSFATTYEGIFGPAVGNLQVTP